MSDGAVCTTDCNGAVRFQDTALPNIIELRNINVSYNGGKSYVIKDCDLLIEDKPNQGQFVVILGPSGCGKSTLLRFIAGLQKPTGGEVFINGQPRKDSDIVSMVFQQYSSMPWMTVKENIKLPLKFKGQNGKETDAKVMQIIDMVGLLGHENKYAQYPILSGGQLQRVAIARCLISNPSILLMDEPYGALDIHTRTQMQVMLQRIWEQFQPTIVFVTHDVSEAVFLGDDIYVMSATPGRIVKHFHVDLPFHRDRDTKRSPQFVNMVQDIEEYVFSLIKDGNPKSAFWQKTV